MSEYMNNTQQRRLKLLELATGILEGRRQAAFVSQFDDAVEAVTPRDVIFVVDGMVKTGAAMETLKKAISQVLNLMFKALQPDEKNLWEDRPFLNAMIRENMELEQRMKAIKQLVKTINVKDIDDAQLQFLKDEIRRKLSELWPVERHYLRKENLLFPYLEKIWPDFRCLQVMWSLHDDVRVGFKLLDELLAEEDMSLEEFNYAIGTLYFSIYPLIYREENILFPVAYDELPVESWTEMQAQSEGIGYAFIDLPEVVAAADKADGMPRETKNTRFKNGKMDLGSGHLSVEQIVALFDHLPVDITFVDAADEVCYFNQSKERHFPRSPAIIGRKVQNCHPPESLDVVNHIVDSFRSGEKDSESFWIQMKGRFIHIRYFAVRDSSRKYLGTLEVSQDVTGIRSLEGEKRLLDHE